MRGACPDIPAPYHRVKNDRVRRAFKRVYRTSQLWPWELLPSHFEPRPEDWNINCSENFSLVVNLVCQDGSCISLDELRDFLVDSDEKRCQLQDESAGLPASFSRDCKAARAWILATQNDSKLARKVSDTIQKPESTKQPVNTSPNEEIDDSEDESDTDILNTPNDFSRPGQNYKIHARQSITLAEPETYNASVRSLIKQGPPLKLQQSVPVKRSRRTAGLDGGWDTEPQAEINSQYVNTDVEMSRTDASHRILINGMIQALEKSIESSEILKRSFQDELKERQHTIKHPREMDMDQARELAVRLIREAQEQLKKAECAMEARAEMVTQFGDECPESYHDDFNDSIQQVMAAARKEGRAKKYLEELEDGRKDDDEKYSDALVRIQSLVGSIDEYGQRIAKDARATKVLYARLAALDIAECHSFDAVPDETLEMFRSSANTVLKYVNKPISDM
ncbi:hypothetical protein FLONG3_8690 [Fusarium longipes]|uniref:Uncharacterized protein n=1 Tax=Fusarium longipes TaxID=694270 RepID=A0A395S4J7_9HYPO|nr:hypothetical protein FLONG3_8690 [Fusarium longipes]